MPLVSTQHQNTGGVFSVFRYKMGKFSTKTFLLEWREQLIIAESNEAAVIIFRLF
jgi:hypothetical protein